MTDNNQEDQKTASVPEKRKPTLFDPKMLQVFLPLLIAAMSGFLMHDREISKLNVSVEKIEAGVSQHHKELFTATQLLGNAENLKFRLKRLEHEYTEIERIESELYRMMSTARQYIETDKILGEDLKKRIREIERTVDKLESAR